MRSGSLRHKITIQEQGSGVDGFGQPIAGSWTEFNTVRASIRPVRGNEKFLSNVDFSTVSHTIRTRYFDGVNSSMRVVFNDRGVERIFNILNVINLYERDKELELHCEEFINGN